MSVPRDGSQGLCTPALPDELQLLGPATRQWGEESQGLAEHRPDRCWDPRRSQSWG